jgi:hypothetical protein
MKVFVKSPAPPGEGQWDNIEGEKAEVSLTLKGGARLDLIEEGHQGVRLVLIGQPNINIQLEH